MKKILSITLCGLALLAAGWPVARPAQAAPADMSYTVDSPLDGIDDDLNNTDCHTAEGTCTLRAAVMQANALPGSFSPITVTVPAGTYHLTLGPIGPDDGASGDLNLTAGLATINLVGARADSTIIDAQGINDRVLSVAAGREANISGVTLRGGQVANFGGTGAGLLNQGTLTVTDSVFRDNMSPSEAFLGGGIFSDGPLTLINSTIAGNSAANGGGIYSGGPLTVIASTVSGNSASNDGGGIHNAVGTFLTLINTTLSQNSTQGSGGGLYSGGTANIYNTTIVFNLSDSDQNGTGIAGGIYQDTFLPGSVALRNSLVAGNGQTKLATSNDCSGTLYAYGQNLFGVTGDPTPCTINTNNGSFGAINSLALLGPLQDNGGPTWTHALLAGSNAIDGGDLAQGCIGPDSQLLPTDQRGQPRVAGNHCDIGAFELTVSVMTPRAYLPFIQR